MGSTLSLMKSGKFLLLTLAIVLAQQGRLAIATPKFSRQPQYHRSMGRTISPTRRAYLVQLAQKFTVKVETPDNQGSGVIVKNQHGTYSVITNEHVILGSDRITVQTHDGRTYVAQKRTRSEFEALDLELLEFQSFNQWYPVAILRPGLNSIQNSPVLAAGFPHALNGKSFQATDGKISLITTKSLNGGYRIGYSNLVAKGMSGGPVLNAKGQVIAINGIHAEPLWGQPYTWDDGTQPSKRLISLLSDLSWAIPSERVLESVQTPSKF